MRLHEGDKVTIRPVESDPYILHLQRHATVSRSVDAGYMLKVPGGHPPDAEFGPIPADRLLPGWRDENGDWR